MAALPDPWKSLSKRVYAIEEQLRSVLNRSPFFGTGVHPNGDQGLDSDNFATGVTGFSLNGGSGNAEFNDVVIRGAVVGVDSPVQVDVQRLAVTGFSLTTSYAQKDSLTVTVPEGCTRLNAELQAQMYVVNQNTTGGSDGSGGDAIYARATIDGNNTGGFPIGLSGFNGFTTTTSFDSFQLTGLTPGSNLIFGVDGKSGYQSIPSYVDNTIKAVATFTWMR